MHANDRSLKLPAVQLRTTALAGFLHIICIEGAYDSFTSNSCDYVFLKSSMVNLDHYIVVLLMHERS